MISMILVIVSPLRYALHCLFMDSVPAAMSQYVTQTTHLQQENISYDSSIVLVDSKGKGIRNPPPPVLQLIRSVMKLFNYVWDMSGYARICQDIVGYAKI